MEKDRVGGADDDAEFRASTEAFSRAMELVRDLEKDAPPPAPWKDGDDAEVEGPPRGAEDRMKAGCRRAVVADASPRWEIEAIDELFSSGGDPSEEDDELLVPGRTRSANTSSSSSSRNSRSSGGND